MPIPELIRLADKYLKKTISEEELDFLEELLKEEANAEVFKEIVKDDYLLKSVNREFNTKAALENTLKDISKTPKVVPLYQKLARYAAILVLPLACLLVWKLTTKQQTPIAVDENAIQLVLEDGSTKTIDAQTQEQLRNTNNEVVAAVVSGELRYENALASNAMNILKVPYGKTFQLQLADGTTVFLNAGSSLEYPVSFSGKAKRQVNLAGEAFFKVAKNKAQPFIVNTDGVDVEVLGTEFNVNSYQENNAISTTLREGSVRITTENGEQLMVPNEQVVFSKEDGGMSKKTVDVSRYTAWMQNEMVFTSTSFKAILKTLERTHNVVIENNRTDINNEQFTARFANENIEQIMTYFSKSYGFTYTINENKIKIE